jgi:hypothetical protein
MAGLALALVFALSELVFRPLWTRHSELVRKIERTERDLGQVRALFTRFRRFETLLTNIESRLIHEGDKFSLFAFLEESARKAGVKERLIAMTPSQSSTVEGYQKLEIAIRFEDLTVAQMVKFLREVENAPRFIQVDQLRVDRSTGKSDRIQFSGKLVTFAVKAPRG